MTSIIKMSITMMTILMTSIIKTSIIITLVMTVMITTAGCDGFHYHPVTEDRTEDVGDFRGIALDGVGEVAVYLNRNRKVVITAHTDVIDRITTVVDDMDILRIDISGGISVDGKGPVNIEVHTPNIAIIELTGNGNIRIVSGNNGGALSKINTGNINTAMPKIMAGTDMQNRLYAAHTGNGNINAQNCVADAVTVKHFGSGSVTVTAVSVLNVAIITNDGDVLYGGDPVVRIPADYDSSPILRPPTGCPDPDGCSLSYNDYDDVFNDDLWEISDGNDERIKRDPDALQDVPPPQSLSLIDPRDGKIYRAVTIGGYTWMAENLNYAIVNNDTDSSWCNGGLAFNCSTYGRLYNWNAASSVCGGLGGGWRLPTVGDWDGLITAAGGGEAAGGGAKLKSQTRWDSYDGIDNTNASGFSALPGGYRENVGSFIDVGADGLWWTADEHEEASRLAYSRWMKYYDNEVLLSFSLKEYGFSVRCVKDF